MLFCELDGIVINKVFIKNKKSCIGTPSAYAYVKFQTREMAERAVNELNYTKRNNIPIWL